MPRRRDMLARQRDCSAGRTGLTHERGEGDIVGSVDISVSCQPLVNRLLERPVGPVSGVIAPTVAQRRGRKARQPECAIKLAHHLVAALGAELRAAKARHTRWARSPRSAR